MAEAKKRILLVEDESDFRLAVGMRLRAAGYEVLEADNGAAGLSMARSEMPDLIVLDLMLPKMDGYKVCRFLKFDEKYRHIPIIMLTARVQLADSEMGSAVGADAYFTKPYQPQELIDTIARLLAS
ncbi:MAG: response regulator [Lentisphaerae bacterium]|nr:response regulator [Lentisphaerota bacterium]